MKLAITTLPGDGIGPEVVAEAMKVLETVASKFGHELDAKSYPFGSSGFDAAGDPGNPDERERRPRPPRSRLVPDSCREVDPVSLVRRGGARRRVGLRSPFDLRTGTISRCGTACTGSRGSSLIKTIQGDDLARFLFRDAETVAKCFFDSELLLVGDLEVGPRDLDEKSRGGELLRVLD